MKKLWCTAAVFALTVNVFAQSGMVEVGQNDRWGNANKVKIEGALALRDGFISVESGGIVYHVPQIERYVGFLEGLKEDAKVSIEGYSFQSPNNEKTAFLRPTKLTLNGREYDFPDDSKSKNRPMPHHFMGRRL